MAEGTELVEESAHQDMPRVVAALAGILERVAGRNDAAATPAELATAPASPFRATTKPGISVRAYAARIARFAGCSPACYVVAYIYLDRLLRRGRRCLALALTVDSYSVHRLLITAVLSAVKFMDDICYNNAYFAKVHQPGGDELPRGGFPVRRRVRPERDAGDVRRLLRRAPVRDALRGGGAAEAALLLPVRGRLRQQQQQLAA